VAQRFIPREPTDELGVQREDVFVSEIGWSGGMDRQSREDKHLGDFGEGLATYALSRKGFVVACVDHVGADLIAQRNRARIAVSVRARRFRAGSKETRAETIKDKHIKDLKDFASSFELEPVFIQIVCIDDDRVIHLFMLRVADIEQHLDRNKSDKDPGYRLRFGANDLDKLKGSSYVDYSCWGNEQIGCKLYVEAPSLELDGPRPEPQAAEQLPAPGRGRHPGSARHHGAAGGPGR
jgi:hypothetical protein